jgi:hypothetical protein
VKVETGFKGLDIRPKTELLWIRLWTFWFHKQGTYCSAEYPPCKVHPVP